MYWVQSVLEYVCNCTVESSIYLTRMFGIFFGCEIMRGAVWRFSFPVSRCSACKSSTFDLYRIQSCRRMTAPLKR